MSAPFPLLSDTDCARIFRRVTGATRWNQEQRELMAEIEVASRAPLLERIAELERVVQHEFDCAEAFKAEAASLRVDAKRYRTMRAKWVEFHDKPTPDPFETAFRVTGGALDSAIDEETKQGGVA